MHHYFSDMNLSVHLSLSPLSAHAHLTPAGCVTHQVSSEEAKSYCALQGGSFRELSARDNKGVTELFTSLGKAGAGGLAWVRRGPVGRLG